MHVCDFVVHTEEGTRSPGTGVVGSWKLRGVDVRNQTQISNEVSTEPAPGGAYVGYLIFSKCLLEQHKM